MKHSTIMTTSAYITIAIVIGVVLLLLASFPKKARINQQNELVLTTVLGISQTIPLAETTDYPYTDDLLTNLIRTNGLSLGKYKTGYYRNISTKQKFYLFLCGKGEKRCFEYDGRIYVVDNITTE